GSFMSIGKTHTNLPCQRPIFVPRGQIDILSVMTEAKVKKVKPDIRAITRLVPPSGNLVQGQSELPIDPQLAKEAAAIIAASQNHYGGSEGDETLRKAVAQKIKRYNSLDIDVDARPFELMITNGGTGALIGIAQSY